MLESRRDAPFGMDMTIHTQFERVVLQILDGIKHLDCILMHPGQTDSNELVNDFRSSLEDEMKWFEEKLDHIEEMIDIVSEEVWLGEAFADEIRELSNLQIKQKSDRNLNLSGGVAKSERFQSGNRKG
ncbi:unnamed protein product [Dovyalis caffra]|uniref:Uncharacterized protein n=1 Tax=Dovyalis caffra TaxID=77055 RepID=A0AAV1RC17_9ROSI|nr:unnamed protein product [Dovyalis caffra]